MRNVKYFIFKRSFRQFFVFIDTRDRRSFGGRGRGRDSSEDRVKDDVAERHCEERNDVAIQIASLRSQ